MKQKISTYHPRCREDISNPNRKTSHRELLRKANVKEFREGFQIKTLDNGRIIVESAK